MIAVVVAINAIAHGLMEPFREGGGQPLGGIGIHGVSDDNASRGDHKNRVMPIADKAIDIVLDVFDPVFAGCGSTRR